MTTAAVQTIWAELLASTLADAGIRLVVVSPGSRSTPIVAALATVAGSSQSTLELVTIVDERAAAFYALGAARATDEPVVLVCTSGTAAAHYLPALVEASLSNVPLIAITADRPPELQACGASQTIDQRDLYGRFVRGSFDLGAPHASESALRGVRRTIVHAVTLARGAHPGPVHINAPFRKPLEPAAPSTQVERDLAGVARSLCGASTPYLPRLIADANAIDEVARTIAREPNGVIVVGAMPARFNNARDDLFALAVRAGYPVIAEVGSQLRLCPRERAVVCVDHFDLVPVDALPTAKVVLQLGAEPVSAAWPAWLAKSRDATRFVFAGHAWHDPEGTARVVLGDVSDAIARIVDALERMPLGGGDQIGDVPRHATRDARDMPRDAARDMPREAIRDMPRNAARDMPRDAARDMPRDAARVPLAWAELEERAASAATTAIDEHVRSETAVLRAAIDALPDGAVVQIGNSLPIRVVDHACRASANAATKTHPVITQRGAAGIDGLISSAAGATRAGKPVLLVLGDVSFAHDLGGLLAARCAAAPLAILVVDNRGGQIFSGLPIARAEIGAAFAEHWLTVPGIDPAAVASALGIRSVTVASPAAVASAIEGALVEGVTVIHAPVSASGAHDVRRTAIEMFRAGEHSAREMKSS